MPRLAGVLAALAGRSGHFPWGIVGAVVFLAVVSVWTRDAVRESLTLITSDKLQTILAAEVNALELWLEKELAVVRSWADEPEIVAAVLELTRTADAAGDEPRDALLAAPALATVRKALRPVLESDASDQFIVADPSGLVLAANPSIDEFVGRRPQEDAPETVAAVLAGEQPFLRPIRGRRVWAGADDLASEARLLDPRIGIAASVRDGDGKHIAVLILTVDAAREFTRILTVARSGRTGETYVLGRDGFMLSESRFEDDLRAAGILPSDDDPDVHYAIPLRDPGGDLTRGFRPDRPADALPLTRLAASATAGESGLDIEGYRDYRGVEVIGAWTWLEHLGFGVATEIDVSEAFRSMRPLNIAHVALLGLLGLAVTTVILSSYSLRAQARQIEEIRQLGQYTLERKLGEGAMGTVYLARHAILKRPAALKLLKKEAVSEESVARFEREVQLTSRLTHPNVIEIFDYGRSPDGVFYYVMEYLDGLTLADLIEIGGPVPAPRVVHLVRRVCAALEEAHAIDLVHRDIKPLNIMVCRRGVQADVVKVLDFGLVKEVSAPDELQLTSPDIVGGTPPYIAPERLKSPRLIDPRSDLFAVGAVAYNLLTGQATFEGETAMEICYKVLHETPAPPSARVGGHVPPALEALVMACMERDPDDRPGNAAEIIERLDAMPEVGGWTQKEARAWWEARASSRPDADSPAPPTT
jgi:tRNA A-37 threonylcarbamoyl transferase component Bud32